ncbi:MAG: formamidopyrimidine-DNA glycosylase [Clostridia bacterium]|nr:formamidopyrimidine-DNA glycosylase [Clostridia bacterium]
MPELPEVETVRRSLEPKLLGKIITGIEVNLPKLIKIPQGDERMFKEILIGSKFNEIKRRGKYLLFYMDNSWVLVIHLRMTGRLLYVHGNTTVEKHTHFIFYLDDGNELRFHDIRQFGLLYLVPQNGLGAISGLKKLGPEPLSTEFTLECLKEAVKGKKQKVKIFLLDQSCIAGIGNIYADEILFQAGIHPSETVDKLTVEKLKALWEAIRDRLRAGVEHRGTSIKNYVDGFGEVGSFQYQLKVYGKAGQPCFNCGKEIERTKVGGRSTAYCPYCQRKSE